MLASIAGIALFFLYEIYTFSVGFWLLLAFGAALFPTCFGIIISSVRKEQQNASSAFGQIFFNLAGFFLAPNVSGYIMDSYTSPKEGLLIGYRVVLGWNVFTLMFLFFSVCFSHREFKRRYSDDPIVMIRQDGDEDRENEQLRVRRERGAHGDTITVKQLEIEMRKRMNSVNKVVV